MKIGFFGTPQIASFSLEKLSQKFDIAFVVTCKDKPQGRSRKVCGSPVKECAGENCIPIIQWFFFLTRCKKGCPKWTALE